VLSCVTKRFAIVFGLCYRIEPVCCCVTKKSRVYFPSRCDHFSLFAFRFRCLCRLELSSILPSPSRARVLSSNLVVSYPFRLPTAIVSPSSLSLLATCVALEPIPTRLSFVQVVEPSYRYLYLVRLFLPSLPNVYVPFFFVLPQAPSIGTGSKAETRDVTKFR
jgi:hypothetical protein